MEQKNTNQDDKKLAPYAARHDNTLGRKIPEASAVDRNEFQRDTSRILHSSSFRQLQYKTQVFANHEGDLFRTRLTHSLEVAQISRSSAKALLLNEDLAESLALAHDLGHAPFGHLGQDALNESMAEKGGYEHNFQALRIVDDLEEAYTGFSGLNLLYETREGILKHCSAKNARILVEQGKASGDSHLVTLAQRFLPAAERPSDAFTSPSLEAQLTDWCDAIAYTHADMEDAVTMKILSLDQLVDSIPLFSEHYKALLKKVGPPKKGAEALYAKEVSGQMMKSALSDLIKNSKTTIESLAFNSITDVRRSRPAIGFSPTFLEKNHIPFKQFLREEVYSHPDVECWRSQQKEMLHFVFSRLAANPKWIPNYNPNDPRGMHRQVSDYIASMTDRSFTKEFQKIKELFDAKSTRRAVRKSMG